MMNQVVRLSAPHGTDSFICTENIAQKIQLVRGLKWIKKISALLALAAIIELFSLLQVPAKTHAESPPPTPQPRQMRLSSSPQANQYFIYLPFIANPAGLPPPPPPAVPKKGVGLTYNDCASVVSIKATWQYGWSTAPANCPNIENVPMMWDWTGINQTLVGNSNWLMGFNEPDLVWQANMTPEYAATVWRQLEQKHPEKKLLSPAPSDQHPSWLVNFRNAYIAAHGTPPRMDGIAVHCYLWTSAQCIQLTQTYIGWAKSWGIAEVWVTEFEFPTSGVRSLDSALQESSNYIGWLESQSIVTRYAWFAPLIQGNESWAPQNYIAPLIDWNTRQPTAYGNMYLTYH